MAERDLFETRFADAYARYLDEAPLEVDAAEVARSIVRAHPRTRIVARVGRYRFVSRLAWLVLAAALLAALGAGALVVGSRLAPAVELAPTAAPAIEVTPTAVPGPSKPAALPASGFAIADLAGRWTGDVTARGLDQQGIAPDPSKDTTFTTTVTLADCTPGAKCGSISFATTNAWGTGNPLSCAGTLRYRGPYESGPAFAFEETIASRTGAVVTTTGPQACSNNMLVLTLLASGATLGVEEKQGGMAWQDYGVLVKSTVP